MVKLRRLTVMHTTPRDQQPYVGKFWVTAARRVSDILSPPLVFAVFGAILAITSQPNLSGLLWAVYYGFLISLLPLFSVIYLVRTGQAKDIHISDQRQRRIPYLFSIFGAVLVYITVRLFPGPPLLGSLAAGNIIGLSALALINQVWLISNHTASITMVTVFTGLVFGGMAALVLVPLVVVVFLARWFLRRHTLSQLVAGVLVGGASAWVLVPLELL
jgi:hypothetical protein